MRQLPGLRRLWPPYPRRRAGGRHRARADWRAWRGRCSIRTTTTTQGFIAKGRAMFAARACDLRDPASAAHRQACSATISARCASSSMPATYVVEPAYRDDGLGLWDFGEDAPRRRSDRIAVDAGGVGRASRRPAATGRDDAGRPQVGRAPREAAATSSAGILLARYPEWDQRAGIERPDGPCVREVPAALGDPAHLEEALARCRSCAAGSAGWCAACASGRPVRLRRQPDGPDLDLDAVIEAAIARTWGNEPDERVYRASALEARVIWRRRSCSTSRNRCGPLGHRRHHAGHRAHRCRGAGRSHEPTRRPLQPCSLLRRTGARTSDDAVKTFAEAYGPRRGATDGPAVPACRPGSALRSGTRGRSIARVRSFRRLVLVLSDAEPSDIDVSDPRDLVEDARRAALTLRARGIDTFGVTLAEGAEAASVSARIFGLGNSR